MVAPSFLLDKVFQLFLALHIRPWPYFYELPVRLVQTLKDLAGILHAFIHCLEILIAARPGKAPEVDFGHVPWIGGAQCHGSSIVPAMCLQGYPRPDLCCAGGALRVARIVTGEIARTTTNKNVRISTFHNSGGFHHTGNEAAVCSVNTRVRGVCLPLLKARVVVCRKEGTRASTGEIDATLSNDGCLVSILKVGANPW